MKVFLSWSGERSRKIAEIFRQWLPQVIQAVKPYFTPDDIVKGARWHSDISKELDESTIGLIFLTPENINSPWIIFEAGALSKHLEKSNVCPICFDLNPATLKGPISHFQAAKFSMQEIRKILNMINHNLKPASLEKELLNSTFLKWWPDLETKINNIVNECKDFKDPITYTDRQILEKILELSKLSVTQGNKVSISEKEILSLIQTYHDLVDHILDYKVNEDVKELLKNLYVHLSRLIEISGHFADPINLKLNDALDLLENG